MDEGVKRMVSLSEVVTDTEGIRHAVYVFSVVIEFYIEGVSNFPTYCFWHLRQSIK